MNSLSPTFLEVRTIIVETLGLEESRTETLTPRTALFGGIPELDSFAVINLAMALEEHFGFVIDDSEFTAEIFDTVGTLADFVDRSRASGSQAHGHQASVAG